MGGGDVKLVGVIGVWVELRRLPIALMVAVILGGIIAIILLVTRYSKRKDVIPFAPFLCVSTATGIIWGETIGDWYLDLVT
jgi:leader peptidase (prepilin peptidase)/N-methyltransferase